MRAGTIRAGMLRLGMMMLTLCSSPLPAQPGAAAWDCVPPEMIAGDPAPGRRVRQTAEEYPGTEVHHSLYLPVDWKKGARYPVLVEYVGNRSPAHGCTGEVRDGSLGYGLSGGQGFIWVVLPYIEQDGRRNALNWWGDRRATIEYCRVNLPRICARFGGDTNQLFLCGFSRGAIAVNYIGLADEAMARWWKGFITHDHYDGARRWGYPEDDPASALKRLARLAGRPVLVGNETSLAPAIRSYLQPHANLAQFTFLDVPVGKIFRLPEEKITHSHTDRWMIKESPARQAARDWLQKTAAQPRRIPPAVGTN